jgi:hypothetical protein
MIGKKELARIHILKKEACLSDEDYRCLLYGAAKVESAKDIDTVDQYYAVIVSLEKYILSTGKIPGGQTHHKKMTLTEVVMERAKRVMGENYQKRMSGYLAGMNRKSLAECPDRELRRIMGFLSHIENGKGVAGARR